MTGFLTEAGQKLADRWAALLVLPGLLYLAAVTVAAVLGQHRALDYTAASRQASAWAASPALSSAGGAALLVAMLLTGSAAAGLAAAGGGRLVERCWTAPGHTRLTRPLTARRRARAGRWKQIADQSADPQAVRRAIERAERICAVEPARPTWIGDRLRAGHVRIEAQYGLDLTAAWPRLWLIVPDAVRTELGAARDAYGAAARLTAWGALYLFLGAWWWPAAVLGALTVAAGAARGRLTTANLADLIEAAVDLYGPALATALGEPGRGPLTPETGRSLSTRMRKSRWDPESPLAE